MFKKTIAILRRDSINHNLTLALFLVISIMPFAFKLVGIHERFSSPVCTIITFILLAGCFALNFRSLSKMENLILLGVNALSLAISMFLNGGLGVAVVHLNMLLMLFILNNLSFPKIYCLIVHAAQALFIFIWLLTLDMELMWKSFVFEPDRMYVNPCTVGIMTLACYYHVLVLIRELMVKKQLWAKVVAAVLAIAVSVASCILVSETGCRASLLAMFLFIGLILIMLYKPARTKYPLIIKCAVLFALLFPALYIGLSFVIQNFEFFGKNFFTQRDNVWKAVYSLIFQGPIFGVGTNSDIPLLGGQMDDAHNLFLGIWKNIGLIPMISVAFAFCRGKNIKNVKYNELIPKLAFATIFFVSAVETVLNGPEYYIFYFTLLLTMKEKTEEICEKDISIGLKKSEKDYNNMIPKKIHYCWFGGKPLNPLGQKCLQSWKKYFPDYEIIEWNESNFDINCCQYVKEAYEAKKWAFVTDYVRHKILYEQGGIYFDTDVEVIKPFDEILARGSFLGCENPPLDVNLKKELPQGSIKVASGLGCAAVPGLDFYREILEDYENSSFLNEDGSVNLYTVVSRTTDLLRKYGLKDTDEIQEVAGITIYPAEYFCPINMDTGELIITENTYSIHRYAASWESKKNVIRGKIYRFINRYFGTNVAKFARKIARKIKK